MLFLKGRKYLSIKQDVTSKQLISHILSYYVKNIYLKYILKQIIKQAVPEMHEEGLEALTGKALSV